MRRAIRRAGLALLAAGAVGSSMPALAQDPGAAAAAPPAAVGPAPGAVETATCKGRLAEIKVELAWMADPITFPYRLGAHADGEALEVHGYVPDEIVRQRALTIASENTNLTVVDSLKGNAPAVPRPVLGSTRQMEKDAEAVLKEAFPQSSRHILVRAQANGTLLVTGTSAAYEEKVAVSHCLRRVAGCVAVVNDLFVPAIVQNDRHVVALDAAGKRLVPAEWLDEDEPRGAAPAPEAPEAPAVKRASHQSVSLGPNVEPLRSAADPAKAETSHDKESAAGFRLTEKPAATAVHRTSAYQASPPAAPEVPPAPAPVEPPPEPVNPEAGKPAPPAAPAPRPSGEPDAWKPHPEILPPSRPQATRPTPPAAPPARETTSYHEITRPAPLIPLPGSTWSRPPAPVPPAPPEMAKAPGTADEPAPTTAAPTPPVNPVETSTGLPMLPPDAPVEVQPLSTPDPLMPQHEAPPTPAVGSGVAIFIDADAAAEPTPAPKPVPSPAQIKQRIEETCGGAARDLEVVATAPRSLLVRFRVANKADGERLSPRVLQLPELGPYQVDLEVRLAH